MRQSAPIPPLPPTVYPLLILGMTGAPCILIVVLLLTTNGTVDLQNPRDLAGSVIAGFLAAVVLGITFRAFFKTLKGRIGPHHKVLKWFALSAPIWWIIGGLGGVLTAKAITAQVTEARWQYAESMCGQVLEAGTAAFSACTEIAHACDDEADQGVCGKANLQSAEAAMNCTQKTQEKLATLPADERALLQNVESNYTRAWRNICILERMRDYR